jgi:hypothetical protein
VVLPIARRRQTAGAVGKSVWTLLAAGVVVEGDASSARSERVIRQQFNQFNAVA